MKMRIGNFDSESYNLINVSQLQGAYDLQRAIYYKKNMKIIMK